MLVKIALEGCRSGCFNNNERAHTKLQGCCTGNSVSDGGFSRHLPSVRPKQTKSQTCVLLMHSHIHTHTHTHTHTRTDIQTERYTHTHTHWYTNPHTPLCVDKLHTFHQDRKSVA